MQLTSPTRRRTRQIRVGSVGVGGESPVSVQSMTTTKTADVDGTLAQIYALSGAGADIVRCTCNDTAAAEGLVAIVPRSPVPVIADIHHQHRMALLALEAGVHGLRLSPGNIRRPEQIRLVATEARDRGVPIRIGVNAGSLDPRLYARDGTEAGPGPNGLIKATAGMAALLVDGIFDTIRYSLTADPVFVKGRNVAVVPEDQMVSELVRWAELITTEGLDHALARADPSAAAVASADRAEALSTQDGDPNRSETRLQLIRKGRERRG